MLQNSILCDVVDNASKYSIDVVLAFLRMRFTSEDLVAATAVSDFNCIVFFCDLNIDVCIFLCF
jgi:hypothetical protein